MRNSTQHTIIGTRRNISIGKHGVTQDVPFMTLYKPGTRPEIVKASFILQGLP
jgi:hypothetical protein